MQVQLTADMQAKLDKLTGETGRTEDEFVLDALAAYFDELGQIRELLDGRYDDLKAGRTALITGEEVKARFQSKRAARQS